MTIEDKILDALTRVQGISINALALQWIPPIDGVINYYKATEEAVSHLVDQGVVVKKDNYYYLTDLIKGEKL